MELFKNIKIDFIGKRNFCYAFSIALLLLSLGTFVKNRGPILGIEFTGGTLLQVGFSELPAIDQIRDGLNKDGWNGYTLQTQPTSHSIIIRIKQGDKSKEDISASLMQTLKKNFSGQIKENPERIEFIGPVIGKKLLLDALKAIFGSLLVIIIYIGFRFKNWVWGLVGVLALAHDVFITWGVLTLFNKETTLVVIAALLTLAGYSINDTIVIFDRVRENARTSRKESKSELYNRSINETLGRTVITSLMALFAAISLFWGGEVIRDFAFAMSFGIFIGSYSTIGVAIALVYQLETRVKT